MAGQNIEIGSRFQQRGRKRVAQRKFPDGCKRRCTWRLSPSLGAVNLLGCLRLTVRLTVLRYSRVISSWSKVRQPPACPLERHSDFADLPPPGSF